MAFQWAPGIKRFTDNFKRKYRVHKSDVITDKDRCSVTKLFLTKFTGGKNVENIEVQLTELVEEGNYDLEGKLWCKKSIDKSNFLLYLTE